MVSWHLRRGRNIGITKIVCISDTHGRVLPSSIPPGDILVHAGDFTLTGAVDEVLSFNGWLGELKHNFRHIVVIAGNHEVKLEKHPDLGAGLITNAIYLQNSHTTIMGFKIYGSPYTPAFNDWAFNLPRGGEELRKNWTQIPDDTDILVTHGPPQTILDRVVMDTRYGMVPIAQGCEFLLQRVLEVRPHLHIFGHIHDQHGTEEFGGIKFINAAQLDGNYLHTHKPIVLEVLNE